MPSSPYLTKAYACFVKYGEDGKAVSFGSLGLKPDAAVNTWHQLEETFTAPVDSATLYLYSGKDSTVWFDDFNIVPIDIQEEKK